MNKFIAFLDVLLIIAVLALAIWFIFVDSPKGLETIINFLHV